MPSQEPAFPDNVPTAPLLQLSLSKLIGNDPDEVRRFVGACKDLGFFYLDLRGPGDDVLAQSTQLFDVGVELFDLPLDEKLKYNFSGQNSYFGYKHLGAAVADKQGRLDRNEFYNVLQIPLLHNAPLLMKTQGKQGRHFRRGEEVAGTYCPRFSSAIDQGVYEVCLLHRETCSRFT
jgi:hypothetical protein